MPSEASIRDLTLWEEEERGVRGNGRGRREGGKEGEREKKRERGKEGGREEEREGQRRDFIIGFKVG